MRTWIFAACAVFSMMVAVLAEGGSYGGGNNYQYASVPHYGKYEFGYKRGNPYHFQERHEVGNGHNFKTKVRWGDKYGGYGEQYYDYNHADKGYGGHGGHGGHGGGGYH